MDNDTVLRTLVLGLVQGLTEFLPVSSSGHLVILPELFGWRSPGLAFDAIVHAGTALAVITYFRSDWMQILRGSWRGLRARRLWGNPDGRLLLLLIGGTLPAVVAGLALRSTFEMLFARPPVASAMLLVTGALLVAAERMRRPGSQSRGPDTVQALTVGLAQAVAIVPGISRSGATIAAGLMVGLTREEATRFSFLLAGPVTVGAGLLELLQVQSIGPQSTDLNLLAVGFVAAFGSGYLAVGWLLAYVRRAPLYAFAAYVWLFGLYSLWQLH